jgi:hypothetical protein
VTIVTLDDLRRRHQRLNARLAEMQPEVASLYAERRRVWRDLLDAGASRESIAVEAGVSGAAVSLAVAKLRKETDG